MNERIKELAEQAGWVYVGNARVQNMEKFANLIVQECARVAALTDCPYTDEAIKPQLGHTWDMACVESAKKIREHFGVE